MTSFDELLAALLEEPEEVLGILSDIVNRGRLQAELLPEETLEALAEFDLVTFLIQRAPRQPMRTYVYPTPLGLRVFATLEREAERVEEPPKARVSTRGKRGRNTGVSR